MSRKHVSLILLCLVCSIVEVNAQSSVSKISGYVLPQTAIKVNVKVAKEEVKKGPYAKFAQQYLGVTAPLNNRTTYSVVGSSISSYDEIDPSNVYAVTSGQNMVAATDNSKQKPKKVAAKGGEDQLNTLFSDMGVNPIVFKTTSSITGNTTTHEKSLEQMAEDAANTIFTLRRRRFDLITGELGENVFGAGLEAAIKEMARIEDEYVALFVGKKSVTYKTYSYDISPEANKKSYILARFSQGAGMVEPADMSGDPVVLTLTAENKIPDVSPEQTKRGSSASSQKFRVADMVVCKLFIAETMVESTRLGVYQFGATIEK